jgi:hypothetical protein
MDNTSNYTFLGPCRIAVLAILFLSLWPSICSAEKVTIGWDPNSESDLEGYVVYRNVGSPGPPYQYADTLPEDDLADPLNPMVTITRLKEEIAYYIAITAYDTRGNESNFSNEICVEIVASAVSSCIERVSSRGSFDSSGSFNSSGSSGGGPCFIGGAVGDSNYVTGKPVIFLMMGFVWAAGRLLKLIGHKAPEVPAHSL